MKKSNKLIQCATIFALLFFSTLAFAQYDSTTHQGLSVGARTTNNASTGPGVPDPNVLDAVTTYTETMVEQCPSGYYPNGAVPTDGTNVAAQNVNGGVIYDQTVTTNRFGTTTYSGWQQVNFLCTAIPPAPTCPTGENEVSAPYWDSTTNQWVGIVCQNPTQTLDVLAASNCQAQTGGYSAKYNYAWTRASNFQSSNGVNWNYYFQLYGLPSNTVPYWAIYDSQNGYSTYWIGPPYPNGGQSAGASNLCWMPGGKEYTAVCFVNPTTGAAVIKWTKVLTTSCSGGSNH
ncbi:hypothetical protein [Paraburkholderia tropica]|uniref:hypothetical protein n=1 Tax=Paraburkholderia tropica TaxID=92647 RepID=UPI003D27CF6B